MSLNKKRLQSEQTKKKLADASKALFVQKGYKATSIEDIVAATGSSKGNIYYHFKSKEGLFLYLIDEWDREWEASWKSKVHLYHTSTEKIYGLAEQLIMDDINHPLTKAADEFFTGEKKRMILKNESQYCLSGISNSISKIDSRRNRQRGVQ